MHIWKGAKLSQPFTRLPQHFFTEVVPTPLDNVRWVDWNAPLALHLGFPESPDEELLSIFSGSTSLTTCPSIAMKYVGHQFGSYNPDLGDGRGLLLCQVHAEDSDYDIHIKGTGVTPYSRQGDGRAVLRSSIREYLMSEAMHNLSIPSSRALGLIVSDTPVYREQLEQGAICIRVAKTHIRFGHFEYLYYTNQHDDLRLLTDYVIEQHFSLIPTSDSPYLSFFKDVVSRTASMIAHWQAIGFAHGVMNTDNMSILGETFDFGPFGMMEKFDPSFICNHSDYQGRYAFDNQPSIGLWNLTALAQSLSPLVAKKELESALDDYYPRLTKEYSLKMRAKLGLVESELGDTELFNELFSLMKSQEADYTNTFRALSNVDKVGAENFLTQFTDTASAKAWFDNYEQRLQRESSEAGLRCLAMRTVNPKYILRNYMAQQAIDMANQGDYSEVKRLRTLLENPYSDDFGQEKDTHPAPDWAQGLALSCSS
ncbi:YdiU family protein [Vibrio sp. S9_S30]|uniref:protein adenylyltransferase SelO n=1 Tax=Vibrio sp. S9_S30 TaxID=2720226 RepID=UPI0016811C17|nr:YdiU family protein [Vibrio sp. S9_S30]MBD1559065.1 YdiU family protein [Vibrio sp. S9_S30]